MKFDDNHAECIVLSSNTSNKYQIQPLICKHAEFHAKNSRFNWHLFEEARSQGACKEDP